MLVLAKTLTILDLIINWSPHDEYDTVVHATWLGLDNSLAIELHTQGVSKDCEPNYLWIIDTTDDESKVIPIIDNCISKS